MILKGNFSAEVVVGLPEPEALKKHIKIRRNMFLKCQNIEEYHKIRLDMSNFDENCISQIEFDVLILNLKVPRLENPDLGAKLMIFN